MMSGAFAVLGLRAVALGQFDAVSVQMIDGPDMDAVGAHHRHMFPDRAMLGHGSSPRCQNHHTRRAGESIHRRAETGRIVVRSPPSTPGPAMAFPFTPPPSDTQTTHSTQNHPCR